MPVTFPKHNIDPALKDKAWIMQCAKAIWDDWQGGTYKIFNKTASTYDVIDQYVLGEQPIAKYKRSLGVDENCDDKSWVNVDWSIRPIASKLRAIGLSKMLSRDFNISCTPIDPLAKDEADNYFNEIKTKIQMREALAAMAPELMDSPAMAKNGDEPEDLEELEMHMNYGFKMKMAMEAELAIQLIMYQNDFEQERRLNCEHLFDYGVGGYKEYIDENGDVRLRSVNPRNVITNHCRRPDFKDKTYVGEVIEINLSQLSTKFSKEELEEIMNSSGARSIYTSINHTDFNDAWDAYKVNVLDFELYSWNDSVYERREDKRNNPVFNRTEYAKKFKDAKVQMNGEILPKYVTKSKEVVYKGKWIIGTEYIYDFGLATNMKRSKPNRANTDLSYHFNAYHFKNMQAVGMMERIIPIIDEYQTTIYKIQNFKNKWLPYVIEWDLDALENVSLGSGGQKMTPKDIMDMVMQHFTLPVRKGDLSGSNVNYKAVTVHPTGMHQEFNVLVMDLSRLLGEMRDILGLNELTDGSSPNPNLLNYVASLGAEATNNALRPLMDSDKVLALDLSKGVMQRLTQAVKYKKIEGLVPALGHETVKFISVSPDLSLHEWGIMIEDKPTQEERAMMMQFLASKEMNGLIDMEDFNIVSETQNMKQAKALLAYRIKKRREKQERAQLEQMQMNGKIQQESALVAEQAKQQTLQLEYQLKSQMEIALKTMDMEIARMKLEKSGQIADRQTEGKVESSKILAEKKNTPKI